MTHPQKMYKSVKARTSRRGFFGTVAGAFIVSIILFAVTGQAQTGQTVKAMVANKKENKMTQVQKAAETTPAASDAIRPFQINIPEEALTDLRRRVKATKWPSRELVADATQGVQLATMQKLASYWSTDYDWRKVEAKLKTIPQFMTTIDGVDIHFIHVKSKHANALPLIITHGWPGSIMEELKVIDPLTNPTAHGGKAEDAFDVVIPSMPGYGFSGKPTELGWDPVRIARVGSADETSGILKICCLGRRLG